MELLAPPGVWRLLKALEKGADAFTNYVGKVGGFG
jgi:hypothetical protein